MWPFNRNSQNRELDIEPFLHSLFDSLAKARKEFPDPQLFDEKAKNVLRTLIVALLTGEGSFDHPATLSAFALGFVLFMVTLLLNFIALRVVKRFREAYE